MTAWTPGQDYVEPPVAVDAVADPLLGDLHGRALLPPAYMPATMRGRRSPTIRIVALALVAVFVVATVLGECLTYGPHS